MQLKPNIHPLRKSSLSLAIAGAVACTLTLLGSSDSHAITRVRPVPDVGKHIFQVGGGLSGSFEENAEGGSGAWSLGWSYHADRSLGIGVTFGGLEPEESIFVSDEFTASLSFVTVDVQVRAPTRGGFVPRVLAGFGYYDTEFTRFLIPENTVLKLDEGRFGMRFGAGLDALIGDRFSVGIIGNYHFVSLDRPELFAPPTAVDGLGEWYDTWDIKAVFSLYTH